MDPFLAKSVIRYMDTPCRRSAPYPHWACGMRLNYMNIKCLVWSHLPYGQDILPRVFGKGQCTDTIGQCEVSSSKLQKIKLLLSVTATFEESLTEDQLISSDVLRDRVKAEKCHRASVL